MSKLKYKEKNGTILYGYSQTSLDKLTWTIRIYGGVLIGIVIYIIVKVLTTGAVNNYIANCV